MSTNNSFYWLTLVISLFWPTIGTTSENKVVLFFDDFNISGNDVDRSVWKSPVGNSGCFGRTAIKTPNSTPDYRGKTRVSNGAAILVLSTFNPTALVPGNSFWGSEIDSIKQFPLPDKSGGIEFAARIRSSGHLPRGIVSALFAYSLTRGADCDLKDEIDFEFPSNHLQTSAGPPKVLINWYKDQPPGVGRPKLIEAANLDFSQFNQFTIRWYSDRIEWYINKEMIHEVADDIPTGPMSVRLNIWVPSADFSLAFSPSIHPVANPDQNRNYSFEVDWVKVSRIQTDLN